MLNLSLRKDTVISSHTTYAKPSLHAEGWDSGVPDSATHGREEDSDPDRRHDVDLRYLKDNVRELEELVVGLLQDRDDHEALFLESVLPV